MREKYYSLDEKIRLISQTNVNLEMALHVEKSLESFVLVLIISVLLAFISLCFLSDQTNTPLPYKKDREPSKELKPCKNGVGCSN